MAGIIVGVDGSHGAHRALDWAMREAAAYHAPLTVVAVHEVAASGWTGNPMIFPPTSLSWRRPATRREEAVAKAAAGLGKASPRR